MKKIVIILLVSILTTGSLFAQEMAEKDVPAAVVSTFKNKFPEAAGSEWKKNKSGKYEVKFKNEGKKAEAKFMTDGQWDSSETRLEASALPGSVSDYLKKNYAAYKIDQVKWEEDKDASKNKYEVKLKKEKSEVELVFDGEGKFIKKKDKTSDKDKKTKV